MGLIEERQDDSFIIVLSCMPKQDDILIGGDLNCNVGRDVDGMDFGTIKTE